MSTSSELDRLTNPRTPIAGGISQATAVEQARAAAEVQAAVIVAQNVPRDLASSYQQMREACKQKALADHAFYSLPRGGRKIIGPSVHLARELARCFGNVQYGVNELRRDDDAGVSELQAWAWDVQNNTRSVRSFVVPHARMANKKRERLNDLGDILNNNNSVAARAVREAIFSILPVSFVEEAKDIANATIRDGGGKTFVQQVTDAIEFFAGLGVTKEQLEARIERPSNSWTEHDLATLRVVGGSLSRGETTREQEFPPPESRKVTTEEITGASASAPAADPSSQTADPSDPGDPWAGQGKQDGAQS